MLQGAGQNLTDWTVSSDTAILQPVNEVVRGIAFEKSSIGGYYVTWFYFLPYVPYKVLPLINGSRMNAGKTLFRDGESDLDKFQLEFSSQVIPEFLSLESSLRASEKLLQDPAAAQNIRKLQQAIYAYAAQKNYYATLDRIALFRGLAEGSKRNWVLEAMKDLEGLETAINNSEEKVAEHLKRNADFTLQTCGLHT